MKKSLILVVICILPLCLVACGFDIGHFNIAGNSSGKASNAHTSSDAFVEIDFLAHALPLVFGPSSTGSSVTIGPFGKNTDPSTYNEYCNEAIPEEYIELRAISGAGKIAGSEDGIVFYFKEVDSGSNFIMEAEFLVRSFGTNPTNDPAVMGTADDKTLNSNGQEGWGIMARDFIPEWGRITMEDIKEKNLLLNTRTSGSYYTGNRGGDSNMIMAGGVKRGARVYWREGIKHDGVTPLRKFDEESGTYSNNLTSGNPTLNAYMDASNCRFNYTPRELGDYTSYTSSDGTPTLAARPDFPSWGSTYVVKLEKTNNGFDYMIRSDKGTFTTYSGAQEMQPRVPLYDILDSVNKEKYYVGLFAARDARVWVRKDSIRYWEADAEKCEPYIKPDPEKVNAVLEVVSPEFYTGNEYLYVKSNVGGELIVAQDGVRIPSKVIFKEWVVEKENGVGLPHTIWIIPTLPHKPGANIFSLTLYPDRDLPDELKNSGYAGKVLGSTTAIKKNFVVTKKIYHNGTGDMYVSPAGRSGNSGSSGSPLDLQTALHYVQPGQAVIMQSGTYTMNKLVHIARYNDGRYGEPKTLKAEERNKVFIDFNKNMHLQEANQGFLAGGSYWVLDGFHVRNTPDKTKGLVVSGHNNILRYIMAYNNGDTGFQLSGSASEPKRYWPSGNTIEYCESFNNMDGAETDADGFAAKLTVGRDNQFLWCIAHNNNDDGWDLFTKKESGSIGMVKFYGCISYDNKRMLNGSITRAGGNGFKLGGEGISVRHEVRQSLSFLNVGSPIMSNSNPSIDVYYSTAIDAYGGSLGPINITSGDGSTPDGRLRLEQRKDCVNSSSSGNVSGNGNVTNYDFESVLYTLNELYGIEAEATWHDGSRYAISEAKKFLKRKPDGRPDMGTVYRPTGVQWATGAWAFYADQKPEPDFNTF